VGIEASGKSHPHEARSSSFFMLALDMQFLFHLFFFLGSHSFYFAFRAAHYLSLFALLISLPFVSFSFLFLSPTPSNTDLHWFCFAAQKPNTRPSAMRTRAVTGSVFVGLWCACLSFFRFLLSFFLSISTLCILIVLAHANAKIGLVHDFFTLQPVTDATVFLLRVILHDWPDAFAHRILLHLREAAAPHTKLVLADFVLPLACVENFGVGEGGIDVQVEGAEKMLAPVRGRRARWNSWRAIMGGMAMAMGMDMRRAGR
jgi:hypothetical protein